MTRKVFGALITLALFSSSALSARVHSRDPQWLKLLHYQKQWPGAYVSQADGKDFFLSPGGRNSPEEELAALILSLEQQDHEEDRNSFCRFPARVRWLRKTGFALPPQKTKCHRLDEFRKQVSARSVYIVFSSYFLSNPASSFGHTFMRLGKTEEPSPAHELIDTGVSYAAETGSSGVIAYIFKGLTGGFPGEFRAIPYYAKVHEYNNSEMRDLWSYQLNFNQEEVDFLVDHLWELGRNHFDYYFMTENCSYHMLTVLEAAKPELNLVAQLSRFYVLPSDTLKVIEKEGLIRSVSFRPSPERVSMHLSESLSDKDLKSLPRVIENPDLFAQDERSKAAALLDAALLKLEIDQEKKLLEEDVRTLKLQQRLMLARASIPLRSPKPNYDYLLGSAPHKGHGSRRLKLGYLNRAREAWTTFGIRGALHDIMDNHTSYLSDTSLEVFNIVGLSDGHRFQVEEYSLVNMLNLRDMSESKSALSWKARAGGWRDHFQGSERQKHGLSGGLGLARKFSSMTAYLLPTLEAVYRSTSDDKFKPTVGGDIGFYLRLASNLKGHTFFGLRDESQNESFLSNEIRFSTIKYGVGASSLIYTESGQHEFQLASYFFF